MRHKLLSTLLLLVAVPLTTTHCVSSKKPQKETKTSAEKFVVTPPADMKKLGTNFDDKVTLVGYKFANKGSFKPGDTITYTLYWRLDKPLGASGWKLFTHVFDDQKKRVLNVDEVGGLRKYDGKQQGAGPSAWQVGKVYADEQTFKIPPKTEGRHLVVTTGIWKGEERLKIKAGQTQGENRAIAFSINVGGAAKQPAVPDLRVDRLAKGKSIKIDGKLDDEAWTTAAVAGPFVNVANGKPDEKLSVQGDAKLLWDDKGLYVGFSVKDKDVVGGFGKDDKDPHLWTKDCVEIMIDPDGDGDNKDYYEIQINPQNLVFDSQFEDYNLPKGGPDGPFGHQEWSSKIQSAVEIEGTLDKSDDEDKGYTVEVKVPWASLDKAKRTPPALGDQWRINLYAMQNNGGAGWSPILGQGNFHKASRFGRLLFAEAGWQPPTPAPSASVSASASPAGSAAPAASASTLEVGSKLGPVTPGAAKSGIEGKLQAGAGKPAPKAPVAPKPAASAP
ncbi:MAG TPA: carbohydrate-binding family 9-like protein [Polyangiaceae bacterium]|jgi:hypothetical protein|nr:carbohydrate-binding family 9-like protein [Polyangiaceae bacterium]